MHVTTCGVSEDNPGCQSSPSTRYVVAEAGLELLFLLLPLSMSWDDGHSPPCPADILARITILALCSEAALVTLVNLSKTSA